MNFLKKKNWWQYLLANVITQGLFVVVIAYYLNIYKEDKWYRSLTCWILGGMCLFIPALVMLLVFLIQITCETAAKLNVPGKEIYNTPYSWILCVIIPVVGWSLFIVMYIYISVWPAVMLAKGEGEKYIKY